MPHVCSNIHKTPIRLGPGKAVGHVQKLNLIELKFKMKLIFLPDINLENRDLENRLGRTLWLYVSNYTHESSLMYLKLILITGRLYEL